MDESEAIITQILAEDVDLANECAECYQNNCALDDDLCELRRNEGMCNIRI